VHEVIDDVYLLQLAAERREEISGEIEAKRLIREEAQR
jgi:hypothetical protein